MRENKDRKWKEMESGEKKGLEKKILNRESRVGMWRMNIKSWLS